MRSLAWVVGFYNLVRGGRRHPPGALLSFGDDTKELGGNNSGLNSSKGLISPWSVLRICPPPSPMIAKSHQYEELSCDEFIVPSAKRLKTLPVDSAP